MIAFKLMASKGFLYLKNVILLNSEIMEEKQSPHL